MLLRSSSTPILSALVSEGDNNCSAFFFAQCNPLLHPRCVSTPSICRAHSETDLQGLVYSLSETDDQIGAGEHKQHHSFSEISNTLNSSKQSACLPSRVSAAYVHGAVKESEQLSPFLMASGIGISSKTEDLIMNVGGDIYGCDGGRGGSGGCSRPSSSPQGDSNTTNLYYQKLLQSDPHNPLFLRNYAQFLSEAKHDYSKSEEYYERAILACPNDGEVLSKYAKHVWDVHKDSERAGSYFDLAVKATPDDCYVLASHASFLWQSEEDDENTNKATQTGLPPLHEMCAAPSPLTASA